jgi:hypothetical protein
LFPFAVKITTFFLMGCLALYLAVVTGCQTEYEPLVSHPASSAPPVAGKVVGEATAQWIKNQWFHQPTLQANEMLALQQEAIRRVHGANAMSDYTEFATLKIYPFIRLPIFYRLTVTIGGTAIQTNL